MLTVYLACLVFGGTLLFFTIAFGAEADADLDMDLNAGGDMDVSSDFDAHGEGIAAAVQFLSFRNLVFFTAFFGLTGSILTLTGTPTLIALPLAVSMGGAAAILCHKLMVYLKDSESGAVTNLSEFVGMTARVTLPIERGHKGKIAVASRDRTHQMLAVVADEAVKDSFTVGETATIVRVERGVAQIAGENFIQ